MKETAIGCGAVTAIFSVFMVFMLVVSVGGYALGYGWAWYTAPFKGALEARQKIQGDGNFRLQAYDSFFNQCSSIQALERDIDEQKKLAEIIQDPQRKEIIQLNVASISGARGGAISRYNQDSQKNWTVAQFKDNNLPYQLPTGEYTGVKTVCATQ